MSLFRGYGLEVDLADDDAFLKIRETLSRIGILSKKDKTLTQSCHILHKQNKYAIFHFKELFAFDGKETNISENDIARRNTITYLLEDWGLLNVRESDSISRITAPVSQIKILPYKQKGEYSLVTKYSIGNSSK